jgi:hypothetical protein
MIPKPSMVSWYTADRASLDLELSSSPTVSIRHHIMPGYLGAWSKYVLRYLILCTSVMRHLALPYSSALSFARSSRPAITPNLGFEHQLRIWEHCKYTIYQSDPVDGSKGSLGANESPAPLKIKPAYKAYLAERDSLLKRGEEDINRVRFSSMASMAAQFGRRRTEREENKTSRAQTDDTGEALDSTKLDAEKRRRDSWDRVEKMEKEWNARLMGGELPGFSESARETKKEGGLKSDDTVE